MRFYGDSSRRRSPSLIHGFAIAKMCPFSVLERRIEVDRGAPNHTCEKLGPLLVHAGSDAIYVKKNNIFHLLHQVIVRRRLEMPDLTIPSNHDRSQIRR